ncbi:MAG: prepilin-type N-terminal cleavage/methylation domain-containing protein [bacterium]|nr:prepilin-type N-terminal cleavage/methylation domain-containing protein [bacterium]
MRKTTSGFTLVELLIVIVVIAILAAITMVAYGGIQDKANDVAVQSDLANYAKKAEIFKIDNGHYPTASSTDLASLQITPTKNSYYEDDYNLYYATIGPDYDVYGFTARSKSGTSFFYTSAKGPGSLGERSMGSGAAYEVIDASDPVAAGRALNYGYHKINKEWANWTE